MPSLEKGNTFEENTFVAGQIVCDKALKGLAAIFGPESSDINEIIQSTSTSLQIPQFQTFWNPNWQQSPTTFNLHPSAGSLSQALATLVRDNDWKRYTVIYENEDGLLRLRESLKQRKPNDLTLTFRKLGPGPDYRSVLKQIKNSEDFRFILDCKADHILEVLRQAREVKLLEDYHSYILTDLDAHSLNWNEFTDVSSNISTIRLINPDSDTARYLGKLWRINPKQLKTQTALMYDAFNVFVTGFRDLAQNEEPKVTPLSCSEMDVSEHGESLGKVIKKVSKFLV